MNRLNREFRSVSAIDHRNLPAVRTASALIRAVRTAGPLLWTIATLRAKKTLACPDNI
jgi:hypothetical protein